MTSWEVITKNEKYGALQDDMQAVVLTDALILQQEDLDMQFAVEDLQKQSRSRTSPLLKALQHRLEDHTPQPSPSIAAVESRRARLLRGNPLLWPHTHRVDHFHDIFWRPFVTQAGRLAILVVVMRFTEEQLAELQERGTSVIWHGVEAATYGQLKGVTVSQYDQDLSLELRYQQAVETPAPQDFTGGRRGEITVVGLIEAGYIEAQPGCLTCSFRSTTATADLESDGSVYWEQRSFASLSAFSMAVAHANGSRCKSRQGWDTVFYHDRRMRDIRDEVQQEMS